MSQGERRVTSGDQPRDLVMRMNPKKVAMDVWLQHPIPFSPPALPSRPPLQ